MLPGDLERHFRESKRVCVFTGAGVSAESGIPTFRDSGGLWENHKPEDLVTSEAFARDPVTVWRWHIWLQGICFAAEPNNAHRLIASMDQNFPEFLLITQNIDTLHERAGTKRMVKLHGDIMELRCLDSYHITTLESPLDKDEVEADRLPKCPECGGVCRPNVTWFGELLAPEPLDIGSEFASRCDLFLIVGTSGMVSGGYGFAELAKRAGALIVEVNPERSALTHLADISIRRPAAKALTKIFHR